MEREPQEHRHRDEGDNRVWNGVVVDGRKFGIVDCDGSGKLPLFREPSPWEQGKGGKDRHAMRSRRSCWNLCATGGASRGHLFPRA
jgi:hypothetical protein